MSYIISNLLLWHYIYSARHETRSCKGTSFARPSSPINSKQLYSYLGLINYFQLSLPGLVSKTTFFREQATNWDWNPSTDQAFHCLKSWIWNMLLRTTLAYYNHTQPLVPQTDASEYGIGTTLLQNNRPIAFASKTFTDVETCYTNIERVPLCLFWPWKISYIHLWLTYNSPEWPLASRDDPEEAHTCSTTKTSMHITLATK